MNRRLGLISALVTLLGILGFALGMAIKVDALSYSSGLLIAWGFLPLIAAFSAYSLPETKAWGYAAMLSTAVCVVLEMIVYFTQLTVVRSGDLSEQAFRLLGYDQFSLFFALNQMGYAFMSLATFFISFTIAAETRGDRWLVGLLRVHGIFAIGSVVVPLLGLFKAGASSSSLVGMVILEFWSAYFVPICLLAYAYFKRQPA